MLEILGRTEEQITGWLSVPSRLSCEGTRIPIRSEECWDRLELQGTILDVDLASGYVVGFEALRVPCDAPPPGEKEQSGQGGGRSGGGRTTGGNKGNGRKADGHKGGGHKADGQKKDG